MKYNGGFMKKKKDFDETNKEDLEKNLEQEVQENEKFESEKDSEINPENPDSTESAEADKVKELEAEIASLKDSRLRVMAEYDNFKRRSQKEMTRIYQDASSDVNSKWLDIVDNLDRASEAVSQLDENSDLDTINEALSGLKQIAKQADKVLQDQGIEEIPALNEKFDPNLHAAVLQNSSGEHESGTITQVFVKGYKNKDRVIRHSVVEVAE